VKGRIRNPDELRRLRDSSRRDLELREGERDLRVTVHMGTCGIAAGAREVLTALMSELDGPEARKVTLTQSGCLGLCDQEPMLTLRDSGGQDYLYVRLDAQKVRRIVDRHIIDGNPVPEYMAKPHPGRKGGEA